MSYVSVALRQYVMERAGGCCEYCRISERDRDYSFHVEHIIALSHGGKTIAENLALSCPSCNLFKGNNIAAADPETDEPTFLFHPRRQIWSEHFRLNGGEIEPLTAVGRVTVARLRFNDPPRIEQRLMLLILERYPCQPATSPESGG